MTLTKIPEDGHQSFHSELLHSQEQYGMETDGLLGCKKVVGIYPHVLGRQFFYCVLGKKGLISCHRADRFSDVVGRGVSRRAVQSLGLLMKGRA